MSRTPSLRARRQRRREDKSRPEVTQPDAAELEPRHLVAPWLLAKKTSSVLSPKMLVGRGRDGLRCLTCAPRFTPRATEALMGPRLDANRRDTCQKMRRVEAPLC